MAGLMEHHRYHHHGGVTLFIAMSVDTLGVSPEQRAVVEKIRTDLHAAMQPAFTADQNLISTLADGLSSSNLEPAKVDAAVAQVVSAVCYTARSNGGRFPQPAARCALTPPQRAALVDRSRIALGSLAALERRRAKGSERGSGTPGGADG